MAEEITKLAAYPEHERKTAERMKWWAVYLIREQRRLQDIAQAIQAEQGQAALPEAASDVTEQPEE
jgi:hypothetical protein